MTSPKWPYFLPVPPNCTPDPCSDPCQNWWSQTDHLAYTGPNLPCTGIETCDTLTVVIQKIEEAICQLMATTTSTTSTSTSTTTSTTTSEPDCDMEGEVMEMIIT